MDVYCTKIYKYIYVAKGLILCVWHAEAFGGSVDWFSSTTSTTAMTTVNTGTVSHSTWTNVDTPVSNGHIDVWPTLTSSGILLSDYMSTLRWAALTGSIWSLFNPFGRPI